MDAQHLAAIYKQQKEITKSIDGITQDILNLQNLLNSDDVCLVTVYTSRIEEFSYTFQLNVTLPTFIPQEIIQRTNKQTHWESVKTSRHIPNRRTF